MESRDTNCRSISTYIQLMQQQGLDVSGLVVDLPVTLEQIRAPETWLDWPTAATIMNRIESLVGGADELAKLSAQSVQVLTDRFYNRLFQLVVSPPQLYRMVVKIIAPAICPYHQHQFERVSEGHLRVVLRIPETGPGCQAFFHSAKGLFVRLPKILAMGDADVTARIDAHHGEFNILIPRSLTLLARMLRLLAFKSRASVVAELEAQQQQLGENHRALQAAYAELQAREASLTQEVAERERVQEAYAQKEQQLRQSQKMEAMGKLSGGVAHDFNNHLTVILLYAEAILEADDIEEAKQYAKKVRDAAQTSAALTKQLLAFARKQMLKPKVLNLNSLILGLDDMLRRTLGERIDLDFVRGAGLGSVRVDPALLEQALVNLVINARDAIGDRSGYLTIETANVYLDREYAAAHDDVDSGRYVMLAVSDDGPGIDAEALDLVFEPFYTTKETGTGLGLSMVQGFVKQSGGLINVYSETGVGTSFKIYLPRVEQNGDGEDPGSLPLENNLRGSETILVVEDEELLCDLVTQMLRNHGYHVLSARDGLEAMRVAQGVVLDLILTDVVMPGMNGPEVVERLRVDHADTAVVYMSGYTENAIVHRGELDEGVILVEKPFTMRELLAVVRRTLGRDQP